MLALLTVGIPLVCIIWLVLGRSKDKFHYILKVFCSFAWVLVAFIALPWAFASYWLRYVLGGIYLVFFLLSIYKTWQFRFWIPKGFSFYLSATYMLISTALALALNVWALKGYYTPTEGIQLISPLRDGYYTVIQGGNSGLTNLFHRYFKERTYRYALDVVEVGAMGTRAQKLLPNELSEFYIYGDTAYCPCEGVVEEVQDSIPENVLGELNYLHNAGNFVQVDCEGVQVLLAHFIPGSIMVTERQRVNPNMPLGRVGNSGYSIEPHLHLQAFVYNEHGEEVSVPMYINGDFLMMNDLMP